MHLKTLGLAFCVTIAVCSASIVSAATLQWLNPFGANLIGAVVNEVSTDGSVVAGSCVVGYGTGANQYAFRWERGGGFKRIGSTNYYHIAYGLSGDGKTVVGAGGYRDITGLRATSPNYYGTTIGSMRMHDDSSDITSVYGASYDGSVLVGTEEFSFTSHAFRWTNSGKFVDLGSGYAYDCSGDGNVVVGKSGGAPVYWDAEGTMHSMGTIQGATAYGKATEISADGQIIAGYVNAVATMTGPRTLAFMWTSEQGMISLGSLPMDYLSASPTALADDGSVVIGSWTIDMYFPYASGGFIWTPQSGMRNMADVLTQDYGLNLNSMRITGCNGMSADGKIIYGTGINAQGQRDIWVLDKTVPEPGSILSLTAGLIGVYAMAFKRKHT